jgi:hypothetical protein
MIVLGAGNGPLMKVPKDLFPRGFCEGSKQPTPMPWFGWTVMFPDMTPTPFRGLMYSVIEKDRGVYVPRPDRFPVHVVWLFFPSRVQDQTFDDWGGGPEPQLKQMRARKLPGQCPTPGSTKSSFAGLMLATCDTPPPPLPAAYIKEAKEKGWNLDAHRDGYVEMPNAPYLLSVSCDDPASALECQGWVQIKASLMQYRFTFPAEAVAHTQEVVLAMNKMIETWMRAK